MKNKLSPIVLFTHNRPNHTRQTVKALQRNHVAKESQLFIYSDAPKNQASEAKVKEVRQYLKTINGFKKVTIIEREKNRGLANSIIDGVTKIVNEYGKVIVLEDDLVTSPYFLKFMNDALVFYENEEKVMHISGYIYPLNKEGLNETFFIKPTSCWGWATWDRAWKYFKKDVDLYIDKFSKEMIKDFNLNNSYRHFDQILLNKKEKLNTWAIFWYASCYLNGGLSLHPVNSFVQNIGHDGSGVHCGDNDIFFIKKLSEKDSLEFPRKIIEDKNARVQVEKYYKNTTSLISRLKNKANRLYHEVFKKNLK